MVCMALPSLGSPAGPPQGSVTGSAAMSSQPHRLPGRAGWLASAGFGWLARLAVGFRFDSRSGLAWAQAFTRIWLSLTRILVGVDLIWLDFGWILMDSA